MKGLFYFMDKNIRFAVVNAAKNDVTGAFMKPDVAKFNKDNLNAIASEDDNLSVTPKGEPGQQFQAGELYVGNFDVNQNKFVSDLEAAPAIKLAGDLNPKGVKADNGKLSENV